MSDHLNEDEKYDDQHSVRMVRVSIMDSPEQYQDRYLAAFKVSDGWVGAVLAPFDEIPDDTAEVEEHKDKFSSSEDAIKWAMSKVIDLDWNKNVAIDPETEER